MMTPETTINKSTLFANMAKVMGEIKRLSKDGFNGHFKYKYASDSDVSDLIRPLLAQNNIAFFASITDVNQQGDHTLVNFEFTFACGETGATFTQKWVGEANDKQDKGISKAATLAEKYFLLKTFLVSTGDPKDDPDSDTNTDYQRQPDPIDILRDRVHKETAAGLSDDEIAKLAGITALTRDALKAKYSGTTEALDAIIAAFNKPSEPVSNGHKQPSLMDVEETQPDRTYNEDGHPFQKSL